MAYFHLLLEPGPQACWPTALPLSRSHSPLFHVFLLRWGGHTKPVWTNLDKPLSFCLSLLSHWDYSFTEKDLPGHLASLVQWHQPSFQKNQQFIHRQLWPSQVTFNPWVFLYEQEISVTFDIVFTTFAVTISPICNNTASGHKSFLLIKIILEQHWYSTCA